MNGVDESVFATLRERIGSSSAHELGEVTAMTIRRYARAAGETDPVHFDPEYARGQGLPDVVAPPNLLVGIVSWGDGGPEDALRRDGTELGEHLPGVPATGVRVMGGGEEMHFHQDVVAGTKVRQEIELVSVERKQTREGTMAVLRYQVAFTDENGEALLSSSRTVLVR